jgi:hypothetical protein
MTVTKVLNNFEKFSKICHELTPQIALNADNEPHE